MKILLTGSRGMLGQEVMAQTLGNTVMGVDLEQLDITDLDSVLACVNKEKPELVINCAAYTDVDRCEVNEEIAFQVNAIGPRNLAVACQSIGAALVHVSTDYVFEGTCSEPYGEYDVPNPRSVYGRTKYVGERLVAQCCNRIYIVRTAWLYGAKGKNFVSTMLNLGDSGKPLKVVNDQIGSPTYAPDLAEAILKLVQNAHYGIYHFTNSGYCSWYDFATEIFRQAGMSVDLSPCTSEEFLRPAKRPPFSKLQNLMGLCQGLPLLPAWQEGLHAFLLEIGRL